MTTRTRTQMTATGTLALYEVAGWPIGNVVMCEECARATEGAARIDWVDEDVERCDCCLGR